MTKSSSRCSTTTRACCASAPAWSRSCSRSLGGSRSSAAEAKKREHEADEITHDVIVRIDRSFITPLDGTVRRAQMFHVTAVRNMKSPR